MRVKKRANPEMEKDKRREKHRKMHQEQKKKIRRNNKRRAQILITLNNQKEGNLIT